MLKKNYSDLSKEKIIEAVKTLDVRLLNNVITGFSEQTLDTNHTVAQREQCKIFDVYFILICKRSKFKPIVVEKSLIDAKKFNYNENQYQVYCDPKVAVKVNFFQFILLLLSLNYFHHKKLQDIQNFIKVLIDGYFYCYDKLEKLPGESRGQLHRKNQRVEYKIREDLGIFVYSYLQRGFHLIIEHNKQLPVDELTKESKALYALQNAFKQQMPIDYQSHKPNSTNKCINLFPQKRCTVENYYELPDEKGPKSKLVSAVSTAARKLDCFSR